MAPVESSDRNGIARCVDKRVVVSCNSLVQHSSGIAVLVPAGVVRAGVTARGIVGGEQSAVGADQGLGKGVGFAVDVVGLDGHDLGRSGLEAVDVWVINVQRSVLINEARKR